MTFKDAVHAGAAKLEDIDDWIEYWHNPSETQIEPGCYVQLHEYLGLTLHEYTVFVLDPDSLRYLI